ncbi:MAG: DUF262 domain-containing protein [Oscillatoriales cyanobacterium]|jgi:hypothetical protein|uniref:DUF262 domain-containing protein n=1 Tax=Microcoleus anatoxicus PTRS2 TaxID=2705321 RepID=A0ABU8YIZ6_9CYAN|nr:MAG: DUF262 domain-containing protein [Oscillatoriales cyanobacterium]TAD94621.1 MAG: DUF262 domain-containing protein [Oscillatoriales cyanobacterium]TAE02336.1 MAG: DUF262 domain-containing protein [Oscillatoriales cyanobacterium]TAE99929.1 MAG: DUF262 domain-containing protein [Oscillatoriales cyanobacterium]TAF37106.1 MAG: DUF262 domain-containing protein [Oscillatoriales cyanobacterium]
MPLASVEEKMWEKSLSKIWTKTSEVEINEKYESGEKRILTEINREKLPNFVEALSKNPKYMNLRPFYQRRARWDIKMQSRLIESFLINIPVPPIILYEIDYYSYEVMDGQQRITAIQDFYTNKFALTGLELWPELNKLKYEQLPGKIKAGLNRRSISSIVILRESTSDPEEGLFLKQKTFERLNTGGVDLSQQEVRNCLYYGKFDSLLIELARHPIFAKAWGIPIEDNSPELSTNNLYKKMEDAELVLRFFALRNVEYFRNGMEGFLDLYMMKSLGFSERDIEFLKDVFLQTLNLAHQIYEESLFKPFEPKSGTWKKNSYKAYYDAVMVGLSRHLDKSEILIDKKSQVIEETKKLFDRKESRLLTGEGRTKADIQSRIRMFDEMLSQVIGE